MKFMKRISLFFIYPLLMFSMGFITNISIQKFFYPKRSQQNLYREMVSVEQTISADTMFRIQKYDLKSGIMKENDETMPDKYIGMKRDNLVDEIASYTKTPSLADQRDGFQGAEMESFSPQLVVIKKFYQKEEKQTGFYLVNENNMVIVYEADLKTIYLSTEINTLCLPDYLQQEIIEKKYIENEESLFNFLESYSS